jgi:hypothetical protein
VEEGQRPLTTTHDLLARVLRDTDPVAAADHADEARALHAAMRADA